MDFLRRVLGLGPRRSQPPRVPTDEVIAATFLDDTSLNRNVVLYVTFRFNDVLDGHVLRDSLSRLLEIAGWRRLGGRFRLNPSGKLEIHIPRAYSPERPAIGYTEEVFDVGIDEHPLATQLPHAARGRSYVQAGPATFFQFARSEAMPATIDDFIYSDAPQISLHVVKFTDGTLVSLSWCHATTDAIGMGSVVRAWSLVLEGHEDEVPEMLPLRDDPMDLLETTEEPTQAKREESVLASKQLTLLKMIGLAFRFFILDPWLYGRMEERMAFVPSAAVQKLKTNALSSLSGSSGDIVLDRKTGRPFLSSGDVVTAWFASMASSVLGPSSKRNVLVFNPFDIRDRLPLMFPTNHGRAVYVQNAVLNYVVTAPARLAVAAGHNDQALGSFSVAIRRALLQQTTEPQVRAMARLYHDSLTKTGGSPMFGDASGYAMLFSNWTKARFFEAMDFSKAVLPTGNQGSNSSQKWDESTPGRPVYYHSQSLMPGPRTNRNWLCFNGNAGGDYWVHGYLPPIVWAKIDVALRRLDDVD